MAQDAVQEKAVLHEYDVVHICVRNYDIKRRFFPAPRILTNGDFVLAWKHIFQGKAVPLDRNCYIRMVSGLAGEGDFYKSRVALSNALNAARNNHLCTNKVDAEKRPVGNHNFACCRRKEQTASYFRRGQDWRYRVISWNCLNTKATVCIGLGFKLKLSVFDNNVSSSFDSIRIDTAANVKLHYADIGQGGVGWRQFEILDARKKSVLLSNFDVVLASCNLF
mmetsp:Transcript_40151/g.78910  ORF Transcript_40151/g.78910 Transcript_40151/m.78910 type:complete len:222 (-) Transcript_40151:1126-1791(-)